MPYSESLAQRVREALARRRGTSEKKMFGGAGFFLQGNLLVAVWHASLIVRLGVQEANSWLRQPHVRDFDLTGKSMKGWVVVDPDGLESDEQLRDWIERALAYVGTLPRK